MLLHAGKRTAPTADHVHVAVGKSGSSINRCHVNNRHLVCVNAKMCHLGEEVGVGSSRKRHADGFAFEFLGIVLGDFKAFANYAVVIVGIAGCNSIATRS